MLTDISYIVSAFFLLMKEKYLKSNLRKSCGTGSKNDKHRSTGVRNR
jgi:hypothetical protein